MLEMYVRRSLHYEHMQINIDICSIEMKRDGKTSNI